MCLTSTTRTRIIAEIDRLEAQLTIIQTTITDALATGIENYSFDSGEGKQSTKYRSFDALLKAEDKIAARIDSLYRRLNSLGVVNVNMRRKRYDRGNSWG